MPNPRLVVDYEGTGFRALSFLADGVTITYSATAANGSLHVGKAVQISANNTVALTLDGSEVLGRLDRVHPDGVCVVQTEGGCTLPGGEAAALTAGLSIVGAAYPTASGGGGGGIKAAASAGDALIGRGQILDSSVTTAVKVRLD
jgi:hypothetical protein